MTRLKGGFWRIKPDHQACFEGGNFIRKGAKGAGPGKNQGGRKRLREAEEEHSNKKTKVDGPSISQIDSFSQSNSASDSMSSQQLFEMIPGSPGRPSPPVAPGGHPVPISSVSTPSATQYLRPSQTTLPSDSSFRNQSLPPSSPIFLENTYIAPGIASPGSPEISLALTRAKRYSEAKTDASHPASLLEPGFELEMKDNRQVCLLRIRNVPCLISCM